MVLKYLLFVFVGICSLSFAATNVQLSQYGEENYQPPRTLIIHDSNGTPDLYSHFFHSLRRRHHKLTFINITKEPLVISDKGKWTVDNLIFLASEYEDLGGKTKAADIIDFVTNGGSLVIAPHQNTVTNIQRIIASYFGVEYNDDNQQVYNMSTSTSPSITTVTDFERTIASAARDNDINMDDMGDITSYIHLKTPEHSQLITGGSYEFLYSGLSMRVPQNSRFVKTVVHGTTTSYVQSSKLSPFNGNSLSIVAAYQSLNGGRAVFTGSASIFTDSFAFANPNTRKLAENIGAWVTHDRGFLRASPFYHVSTPYVEGDNTANTISIEYKTKDELLLLKTNSTQDKIGQNTFDPNAMVNTITETTYRIGDNFHIATKIEQYDGVSRKWIPATDPTFTFEFELVDPYHRQSMIPIGSGDDGLYYAQFRLPDIFGVYTARVVLDQFHTIGQGYSVVNAEETISVRPYKHDEYESVIDIAIPYYVSIFSVMASFLYLTVKFMSKN